MKENKIIWAKNWDTRLGTYSGIGVLRRSFLHPSISDITSSSSAPIINSESRRSKRIRNLISFGDDFFTYLIESDSSSFKKVMDFFNPLFWKKKSLLVRSSQL